MSEFRVVGPIPVKLKRNSLGTKRIDDDWLREVWKHEPAGSDIGCYVLCHKASKGEVPFYVGKTRHQSFEKEALSLRNIGILNKELFERTKGSIVLYLLPIVRGLGKPSGKAIADLEKFLVNVAHDKNKNLRNKKLKAEQIWSVHGLINAAPGKPSRAARQLRRALSLERA